MAAPTPLDRGSPSGPVLPALGAGILTARYVVTDITPAAGRLPLAPAGPQPWPVDGAGTSVVTGPGKFIVALNGSFASLGNGYNASLGSTSGGVNLAGFSENTTNNFRYVTMLGMFESNDELEEVFAGLSYSPDSPVITNTNLYIARIGN